MDLVLNIQMPNKKWKTSIKGKVLITLSFRASSRGLGMWLKRIKASLKKKYLRTNAAAQEIIIKGIPVENEQAMNIINKIFA